MALRWEETSMRGGGPAEGGVDRHAERRGLAARLRAGVLGLIPWAVIALLLIAAFTVRPGAVGKAVQPPPISRQDDFYGIAHPAPQVLWLAGNLGKIVRSDDGGRSWTVQETPTRRNLQAIAAWNANDAVAVGDGATVLVTDDGGRSWKQVAAPHSKVADKFIRVRIMPDGSAWIVGVMGAVLESTDHGRTWTRKAPVEDVARNDIAGVGDSRWVVGEFGSILVSRDGGATWSKDTAPVQNTLNGVRFRDAEHGVAVGLQGTILVTDDGGRSWKQVTGVTGEHLFAVAWDGHRWMAAGADGLIVEVHPNPEMALSDGAQSLVPEGFERSIYG